MAKKTVCKSVTVSAQRKPVPATVRVDASRPTERIHFSVNGSERKLDAATEQLDQADAVSRLEQIDASLQEAVPLVSEVLYRCALACSAGDKTTSEDFRDLCADFLAKLPCVDHSSPKKSPKKSSKKSPKKSPKANDEVKPKKGSVFAEAASSPKKGKDEDYVKEKSKKKSPTKGGELSGTETAKAKEGDESKQAAGTTISMVADDEKTSRAALEAFDRGKVLGNGSFGCVKLVTGEQKKKFAMKVFYKAKFMKLYDGYGKAKKILNGERDTLIELRESSQIIDIYSFGSDFRRLYLTLEVCDFDLLHVIKAFSAVRCEMPRPMLYVVLKDMIDGQAFMHSKSIIHRDTKPDNVFVIVKKGSFRVVLADFGLAKKIVAKDGKTGTAGCGTEAYSAPEMLAKSPSYNVKADVWSLGCTLLETFSGTACFSFIDDIFTVNLPDDISKMLKKDKELAAFKEACLNRASKMRSSSLALKDLQIYKSASALADRSWPVNCKVELASLLKRSKAAAPPETLVGGDPNSTFPHDTLFQSWGPRKVESLETDE